MSKFRVYLLGIATLLMVPLAWCLQGFPSMYAFFRIETFSFTWTVIGLEFGIVFAFLMLLLTSGDEVPEVFDQQSRTIRSMRLNVADAVFLSFCAGFGEEMLFRIALQEWIPPLINAVLFVAVHRYIRIRDWQVTKYGLLLLLFIIALSYAVYVQGIWFCIAAHFSYDFVLFYQLISQKSTD